MTIDGFIKAVARKVRKTKQKGFLFGYNQLVRFDNPDDNTYHNCPIEFLADTEPGTAGDSSTGRALGLTDRQQVAIMVTADEARPSKRRAALLRACGIRVGGASR